MSHHESSPRSQPLLQRFNAKVPWPLRISLVIIVGLIVAQAAIAVLPEIALMVAKLRGEIPDCPWKRVATAKADADRFIRLNTKAHAQVSVVGHDAEFGIDQVATPQRVFWVRKGEGEFGGASLIAYLLAEHLWMTAMNPETSIKPGDVVIDCGAHVGVFTAQALRQGASKVVAIEPERVNLECLRRNFQNEIASGQVIIVSKGVWSSETTLGLRIAPDNSGANTVVFQHDWPTTTIQVTTIDSLVKQLGLRRVDYIKMDIEGAAREALTGAAMTLKRFRPRLMIEAYHRPDDAIVLPDIIRRARPDYRQTCGPCTVPENGEVPLVPYVIYFR